MVFWRWKHHKHHRTITHAYTSAGDYTVNLTVTDDGGASNSAEKTITIIKNGDVNGDGEVTLFDAMYLAKHVLGESGFEKINEEASEISGDGEVTLFDAKYLAKHVLGEKGFEVLY